MGSTRWAASSPARATPASCRTCAASSRPRASSTRACTRSRTATTRSSWVVAQEWCDGRVGLWGESYYGFTSWPRRSAATRRCACIAPGDIGVDRRGAGSGRARCMLNTTGYWAIAMDAQEYADVAASTRSTCRCADMPRPVGLEGALLPASSSSHAEDGAWWAAPRPAPTGSTASACPVLSWTAAGTTTTSGSSCATTLRAARAPSRARRRCTCWSARGITRASAEHTDRAVCVQRAAHGAAPLGRLPGVLRPLPARGRQRRSGAGGSVEVFTLGPNALAARAGVAAAGAMPTPLYLRAGGRRLASSRRPPTRRPTRYRYDPARPGRRDGRRQLLGARTRARRPPPARRPRRTSLRYVATPLAADLELTGPGHGDACTPRPARPDTDFTVDAVRRVRGRHGEPDPGRHRPRALPQRLERPSPMSRARRRVRGRPRRHQLRRPRGPPAARRRLLERFDRYDRNPNTGAPLGATAETAVAEQTIHHDPARPSHVVLPVVGGRL